MMYGRLYNNINQEHCTLFSFKHSARINFSMPPLITDPYASASFHNNCQRGNIQI